MGEQDEWGQTGETELGATVSPPTRHQYRYHCATCQTTGQLWDSESDAQSDGLSHEHSIHPRVYTVQAVGTYD